MKKIPLIIFLSFITSITYALDSDLDGIDDAWEMFWFGNLTTANATSDYEHDGVTDLNEFCVENPTKLFMVNGQIAGSNPTVSDTDGDGLTDSNEFYHTFQIVSFQVYTTNPIVWYYFLPTNVNTSATSSLLKTDSDGDGISDYDEVFAGTDPNNSNDYLEVNYSLSFSNHPNNVLVSNYFLTITWKPVWNRGYIIEGTTNLCDANSWTNRMLQYGFQDPTNGLCNDVTCNLMMPTGSFSPLGHTYSQGSFQTNFYNTNCSWSISLGSNPPSAFYRLKVASWVDWTSDFIDGFNHWKP
jgi:hypothetical protein